MNRAFRLGLAGGCLALGVALGAFFTGSATQGQGPGAVPPVRELTSYREVVKKVLSSVVAIEAKAKAKPRIDPGRRDTATPDDPNLGFGSGWIVDSKGVILTNYHVVEGAEELEVQMIDGRKFTTRDFIVDRRTDLAVVRVQSRLPLPALEFGDSDQMEIGDRVLALGSPFGLKGSVTSGIVSAKGRNLKLTSYEDFLQTDAAMNPGSSGGPLVNLEGKVVGMTSAIKSRSGGFQGVGLAISSNLVRWVLGQLLRDGVVRRGYIGMQVDDIDPDTAARIGIESGVLVKRVLGGSPAEKAGLRAGDVITIIDGKAIKDGNEMQRTSSRLPIQQPVEMSFVRSGKILQATVTVVELPEVDSAPRKP